jgi:hypothetical protein
VRVHQHGACVAQMSDVPRTARKPQISRTRLNFN